MRLRATKATANVPLETVEEVDETLPQLQSDIVDTAFNDGCPTSPMTAISEYSPAPSEPQDFVTAAVSSSSRRARVQLRK